VHAIDYDGKDGPEGHPDLKGFGRDGRVFFWLRQGDADAKAAHIGFVAKSKTKVNAFYEAAIAAGATDNGKPAARLYYDPRYYAANVFDPDGYKSGGGLQELATPPIIGRRSRQRKSNPQYVRDASSRVQIKAC
jgi:glyoxalase/bleomycin resistance protein/dioxygenase superfamily protein